MCLLLRSKRNVLTLGLIAILVIFTLVTEVESTSSTRQRETVRFEDYQVSDAYPPNKQSTWHFGVEIDGWKLAHDGLKHEMQDFESALHTLVVRQKNQKRSKIKEQIKAIAQWWKYHLIHVESHHNNEDKITKRFVQGRFKWPSFMEKEHDEIEVQLLHIGNIVSVLEKQDESKDFSSITDNLERLLQLFASYRKYLERHFDDEEHVGIPLQRAYFTPQELQPLTQKLGRSGPRVETGAIAYYLGIESLHRIMKIQNMPTFVCQILSALILQPRKAFYERTMVKYLEIIRGQPSNQRKNNSSSGWTETRSAKAIWNGVSWALPV